MILKFARPLQAVSLGGPGPERTIGGLAVPWNVVAMAESGKVKFLPGSLPIDGPAPKLLRDHDVCSPIGLVIERTDAPEGLRFTARISETEDGDEALILAADGVLDMVSVGVEPTVFRWEGDVCIVEAGLWLELSLLAFGAFPQARVDHVAAPTEMPPPASAVDAPPAETPAPDPTDPAEMAADPNIPEIESPEGNPMSEMIDAAAAPVAVIPTAPLMVTASRPRITAAEWMAGKVRGTLPANAIDMIRATAGTEVPDDIPGLIPELLVDPLYDSLLELRPIIGAIGTYAMPGGGETFYRRYVDQHVEIAEQAFDGSDFATQSFKVERLGVDKKYFGGRVTITEAAQLFSDTVLLSLILSDLSKVYGRTTEIYAAQVLTDGAGTAASTISDLTDGDEVVAKLFLAAAEMRGAASYLPTHLICSTAAWAKLGASKNAAGNFVFPFMSPMNAAGQFAGPTTTNGNPLGLNLVVSGDLADDDSFLLNSNAIEFFEDRRGALSWVNPSNANTEVSFRGLFGGVVIDDARVLKVA